jgi:hypothetical protein
VGKRILAGLVLAWPLATWAADTPDVKLGLWENTTTIATEAELSGKAAKAAAAMPKLTEEELDKLAPEAREAAEARMQGRRMVGSPKLATIKACQTETSWVNPKGFGPAGSLNFAKVLSTNTSVTKTGVRTETQLESSNLTPQPGGIPVLTMYKTNVVADVLDPEHVKVSVVMKSEERHPITTKMSYAARWLSADCGDVKPLTEKK